MVKNGGTLSPGALYRTYIERSFIKMTAVLWTQFKEIEAQLEYSNYAGHAPFGNTPLSCSMKSISNFGNDAIHLAN